MEMNPIKNRPLGQPIPVERVQIVPTSGSIISLSTG